MRKLLIIPVFLFAVLGYAQKGSNDSTSVYKKRVLESVEIDFLASYYTQDGNNGAVCGGIGTEELTNITPTLVVSVPLNDDDVLTIDAGISAYSSASSSNINPFDGSEPADPYIAASGASSSDVLIHFTGIYSHSSDDRNNIWSAKVLFSNEYDYSSIGFGGSYSKLFNEKNTEVGISANVFFDKWKPIYPYELRPFAPGGDGLNDWLFQKYTITGNPNYNPTFTEFDNDTRQSYSVGFSFSQILSSRMQGSLLLDFVQQQGLLSTPFHRVYFKDVDASYIQNFHLADDIERLPDSRFKVAAGGRLNYYINEIFVVRLYYRYYFDDWGINSNTASIEVPVKISDKFTLYPSYRFYNQSAADYFAPYNEHSSTEQYYTSDYDLSEFNANQYGLGLSYTDVFTKMHIWRIGIKSVDLKYRYYERNTGLKASIITGGVKFILQ